MWAQGRVADGALDGQSDSTLVSAHHPLAYQGDISFHGVKGSMVQPIIGGLSADVWEHVVDWKPGAVHGGAELAAAVQRLQRLTSVRHVSVESSMREEGDSLRVDVGLQVQHGAPYDLSLELDLVRNNVRYGPRASLDLAALNARSRGGRRSVKVGFGYVAAEPFSTFSKDAWLNSAEWSLHWNAERLGFGRWPCVASTPNRSHARDLAGGTERSEFTRQSDVSFVLKTGRTGGGELNLCP